MLGNQVIFAGLNRYSEEGKLWKNLDSWDGYPQDRKRVIDFFEKENIENILIVSGDSHASWAFEVPKGRKDYLNSGASFGVEFGTPSVTSGTMADSYSMEFVDQIVKEITIPDFNPHLKYLNFINKGYLQLTIEKEETKAEWIYVDKVK